MLPYFFLFFLGAIVYFDNSNKPSNVKINLFVFFLIVISGLRDMIGGFDVYIYGEVFEKQNIIRDYELFELGFNYYFRILYFFGTSREFMFFVTAFIILASHIWLIRKTSVLTNLAVYVYFCKFFLFTFIYLRQGIGMAIIWLAIYFLFKEKKWFTYFFVIVAFYFHKSSIMFIPFLFIYKKTFSYLQMLAIFAFFLAIALSPLGSFLTLYFAENIDNKYVAYSDKFSGVNIFYLLESAILIYLLFKYREKFYAFKKGIIIYNGMFVYVCMQLMGLTNATFTRIGWYYLIFLLLFLSNIYKFIPSIQLKSNYKLLMYVYFSLVFLRLLIYYDGGDLIPFKFIFEDFERNGMWEFLEYRS
ncbi:EpsG family protein [Flavobacterium sp.]|uniref:EpsG family protein n=1 Tax=Flavobacterium sp. TaxID=239 RepID=UPI003F69D967